MNDRVGKGDGAGDDPRLAAVERRLGRRAGVEPSPAVRHRVLMAVDDELVARRSTVRVGERADPTGWPWLVAAAAAGILVAVAGTAAAPVGRVEPVGLVERVRSAGVNDEGIFAMAAASRGSDDDAVSRRPRETGDGSPRPSFRAIDARRLLQEDL